MRTLTVMLLLAAALALPALAQTHEHAQGANGEHFVVLHDGPASGRAIVGGLTHLGFALVSTEGAPVRHHDATFTLTQNGVVLFRSEATHEYDGLFSLDYTFTVPGPYEVLVESDTGAKGTFNGTVVAPVGETGHVVEITVPEAARAGEAATIGVRVLAANGTIVPHSDALVDVRRLDDGLLVHRGHLHTHEDPMAMSLALALPGEYEVTVYGYLAFPSGRLPDLATAVGTARFTVAPPAPGVVAPLPMLPSLAPARAAAAPDASHASGLLLSVITDPADRNGPFNHQRLNAFVWDPETMAAQQHVNFKAVVRGATGVVPFASESLHEYDGHLEILLAGLAPDVYTLEVEASYRNWTDTKTGMFVIVPPVVPAGAGPAEVAILGGEGLQAGVPAELTFSYQYPGGVVIPHSEVNFDVFPAEGGAPLLSTKVHTHETAPTATLTFPRAGEYVVVADGDTLQPTVSVDLAHGTGFRSILKLTVAEGPGLPPAPDVAAGGTAPPPVLPAPALPAAAVLAGLALVAATRRLRERR